MLIAWEFPCPARKPTTRSLGAVGVRDPELGVVLVFDAPTDVSSGFVAATPANSWTWKTIEAAEAVRTVTVVAGDAPATYQSSPSELCPDTE
jgi:hypothetical protein